ncbi:MAG: phosphoenolpyruvate--protein phosphotransferase [Spirochaetes bacterium GWD1_61_31]|nr:MAG: phosphoenolpyruvate--protein phosphotransferase [Spirochaetes bacterium GWB1_60_80]OHD29087.1 MAG: phosphoenolpyruvate--protein phosphotransferase [Spirochaetes bacterium GWC1_61_12]OHD43118.1 MAG: phosphoenolpyruvate--protein phosphotransferase [Spirochaetes bacterium GWD1_61_31]OHD44252.1 MAG: phosphoenolpyruvate--protein phosphotransferase [Spirochaetes bacterium GWE1_60_18]OHD60388.1 MAG: phosphoenolpyruvate--protein phosphotransferase [Spirochaetes bacterium GWF1_60_12]HAP43297.1 
MRSLSGIPASSGIAIARAFVFLDDDEPIIPRYAIAGNELAGEWQRFQVALEKAREDIVLLRDRAKREMGDEHSAIFDAHLLMLEDVDLLENIEKSLNDSLLNIEWVLHQYSSSVVSQLESLDDPHFQERSSDVHDITHRILNHLMFRERFSLADLPEDVVLVAHNLLPSDMISMTRQHVKAIVMDAGGKTSHTAILARAFEIPAVLGLSGSVRSIKNGEMLIVNGQAGLVIVDPDTDMLVRYENIRARVLAHNDVLIAMAGQPAVTKDGIPLVLKANIEVPDEIETVIRHGAAGIGLFRSEFLFLQPGWAPSEEDQFSAYRRVLAAMNGKPVTIRTLDVGGDKVMPDMAMSAEKNPLLGWRAIRYCLFDVEMFQNQLRAILRASAFGDARIMFPMISGPDELDAALAALDVAKQACRDAKIAFREDIPVGIMIEIPSAALIADILARKVSFFSIGTNDLIQYTIAVDRGNERVAYLHEPFHPAVLRLIKRVIDDGHAAGISVSMCGEMASDPAAAIILLGLGLDEFSMSAASIPLVKRVLGSVNRTEASAIAAAVLTLESHRQVEDFMQQHLGGLAIQET